MARKVPIRDPIAAHQRQTIARRRVGENARCACGESRPEALVSGSNPAMCAACDRKKSGKATVDRHHVAGKSNSPTTIRIPVNDHLAELNRVQYDWPKQTLENPNGSPLLAMAASIRGYSDTNVYLIQTLLLSNPEILEALDAWLTREHGPEWWIGTTLEQYARKR